MTYGVVRARLLVRSLHPGGSMTTGVSARLAASTSFGRRTTAVHLSSPTAGSRSASCAGRVSIRRTPLSARTACPRIGGWCYPSSGSPWKTTTGCSSGRAVSARSACGRNPRRTTGAAGFGASQWTTTTFVTRRSAGASAAFAACCAPTATCCSDWPSVSVVPWLRGSLITWGAAPSCREEVVSMYQAGRSHGV